MAGKARLFGLFSVILSQTASGGIHPLRRNGPSEAEAVQQVVYLILACHNARFGGVELWAIKQAFVLAFRTCSRFRDVFQIGRASCRERVLAMV